MTTEPDTGAGDAAPDYPDGPALSVAAVARRLGVAPSTLRTWDRRYGLGPSGHTTGHHRRYGAGDLVRLELMQRALVRGASPAEAARYALTATVPDGGPVAPVRRTAVPGVTPLAVGEYQPEPGARVQSGGRALSLPGASRQARGLGRAVLALDGGGARQVLVDAIDDRGVVRAWDEVARPVLCAVSRRWAHSGEGVELEHLLSACVIGAFGTAFVDVPAPSNPRPVLLATMPDELHCLPLHPLAAELARRRIGVLLLGAAVPADALASAIRRTAPSVLFLWAQLPRYGRTSLLSGLPRTRQRARVFAGGPGWRPEELSGAHELLDGLAVAVDRIERVALGG